MMRRARRATGALLIAILGASAAAAPVPPGFILHEQPRPLPEVVFEDQSGTTLRLADFRGRVVLLNLWATWCAPCRREMPTLDRLQAMLGGPAFEVVALSVDREGVPGVAAFYEELGLEALAIYVDSSTRAMRALGALGLPTTLLLDREGTEGRPTTRPGGVGQPRDGRLHPRLPRDVEASANADNECQERDLRIRIQRPAILQGEHDNAAPRTHDRTPRNGRERDRGHADGSAGVRWPCGPADDARGGVHLVTPTIGGERGKEVFVSKVGCIACHANGVGGHDAPKLDGRTMQGLMNSFDFAARMWNHAPTMILA